MPKKRRKKINFLLHDLHLTKRKMIGFIQSCHPKHVWAVPSVWVPLSNIWLDLFDGFLPRLLTILACCSSCPLCCHGWGLGLVGWQIAALALFSWIVVSICCCPVYSHFFLTSRDSFLAAATWCYRLLHVIQSNPMTSWNMGGFIFHGPHHPFRKVFQFGSPYDHTTSGGEISTDHHECIVLCANWFVYWFFPWLATYGLGMGFNCRLCTVTFLI